MPRHAGHNRSCSLRIVDVHKGARGGLHDRHGGIDSADYGNALIDHDAADGMTLLDRIVPEHETDYTEVLDGHVPEDTSRDLPS